MNNAYKTFIALTLATAACFRTKAQSVTNDKTDNFMETLAPLPNTQMKMTESQKNRQILPTEPEQVTPSFLQRAEAQGVTSALVEHPQFEEDSVTKEIPRTSLIAPNVLAEDNVTPWEITPEGQELMQTWLRLQKDNGDEGELTADDVGNLQKIAATSHRVGALEAGLRNYEMDGEDMLRANTDSMGVEIERSAVREANGPGERCYRWVKHILMGTNPIASLEGDYACQGADGLHRSPNVVGTTTRYEHMDKLVPGAIAVFGRGPGAYAGHILIGGAGQRNLVKAYETSWGKKYWYSPARDVSDKNRNANVTGHRGSRGRYAPKPEIFFTKNSTVAGVTILKIGYQYTRDNTSQLFFGTQDVYNSVLKINVQSAELAAQKIIAAQKNVQGFVKADKQTAYHQYPNPRLANPRGYGKVSGRKNTPVRKVAGQPTLRSRTGRT